MFWDVWEYFVNIFKNTVFPALKNLFSSKRFFASMFIAIFVLQTLLCVICIAGINNVVEQNAILDACSVYIAANTGKYTGDAELAEQVEVISGSVGIFFGALFIWWICAMTVYYRMAAASSERNRYVWGLYITFGAYRRKIRSMLLTELYLTLGAGMALGFPTAYLICRYLANQKDLIALPTAFLIASLIAMVSIRICAEIEIRIITSKNCTKLLMTEGTAVTVCEPRRSGTLSEGFSAFRYAGTAFWRLRKYYASVALAAAIPVALWVCCMTASTSETQILRDEVHEFNIRSKVGFEADVLKNEYIGEIEKIPGVNSVQALASGHATEIGTHILLNADQTESPGACVTLSSIYADGEAYIVDAYDPQFMVHTGFKAEPKQGEVIILMPHDDKKYFFDDIQYNRLEDGTVNILSGAYLMFAVSKSTGEVHIVDDSVKALEDAFAEDEFEYLRLHVVGGFSSYRNGYIAEHYSSYTYTDRPYFVLNSDDYEKITSISLKSMREIINPEDITIDTSLYADGSFVMKLSGTLNQLPQKGDVISINNELYSGYLGSVDVTAYVQGEYLSYDSSFNPIKESEKTVNTSVGFYELYIIDAFEENGNTYFRVAPNVNIRLHSFYRAPVAIANFIQIGTPEIEGDNEYGLNDTITYVAATYDQPFSINYSNLKLHGSIIVCRRTAIRSIDVGTHILFEEGRLINKANKFEMPPVYATNDFVLACFDQLASYGFDGDLETYADCEAVILMPESATKLFSLHNEDKFQLAYVKDINMKDSILNIDHLLRLSRQLQTENYQYVTLGAGEIVLTDDVDEVTVFVPRNTYSDIIDREHPYDAINISIDSQLTLNEYNAVKNELALWIHLTEDEEGDMALSATNNFFDILLRRAADYSVWLKVMSALIPLLIIPVWYYPQTMMFSRRKDDYKVLFYLGKTSKNIRTIFAAESLFAALTAVIAVLLCIPLGTLFFDLAVDLYELPIEFNIQAFNFKSLVVGCTISIIGAIYTVWLGYLATRKEIKNHGNS